MAIETTICINCEQEIEFEVNGYEKSIEVYCLECNCLNHFWNVNKK